MKYTLLLLLLIPFCSPAQFDQQDVFTSASGQGLIDSLHRHYKPSFVLHYDQARDTLFSKVYALRDTVRCVYTGRSIYVSPSLDPSTVLYSGGQGIGINTEHSYPQSKGASQGHARSDMHHLFPVRASANSARNNFPYSEIEDDQTNAWYYDVFSEDFPSYDISQYSELDIHAPAFEPREDHKGNAARAMFYFYTMYKEAADAADPSFFAKQVSTLCQWHLDDPVDSLEWERNYIIASYQDNKANPFILDCSLPYRSYCPYLPHNSCYTSTTDHGQLASRVYMPYPNPSSSILHLSYDLEEPLELAVSIYNAVGQFLYSTSQKRYSAGFYQQLLDVSEWPVGIYFYRTSLIKEGKRTDVLHQFMVQH
jgi:hypothetical protein